MRQIIAIVLFVSFVADISYADIFSQNNTNSTYDITNAVSEDKSGFYYKGGIDYNPPVTPAEPTVGYSIINGSKGCSGFLASCSH